MCCESSWSPDAWAILSGDGEVLHVQIGFRHTVGGKRGHLAQIFTSSSAESPGRRVGTLEIVTRCIALVVAVLGIGNVSVQRALQQILAIGQMRNELAHLLGVLLVRLTRTRSCGRWGDGRRLSL